ncbi:MAG: thermonuclease family protein [Deltaproteobacteria bacterium]|nr:thermonuclease family protein [Deltaproteobacteria bacterium]
MARGPSRISYPASWRRVGPFLALLAFGLLFPAAIPAVERAEVVEIVDGDTVRIFTDGNIRTVRLIGIDAPERSHPSRPKEFQSDEASDFLATLCGGKIVEMEGGNEDTDRHGRLLRYLVLPPPDGRLVNREMVRHGYARVNRGFPFSREAEFTEAEKEARREGKGIWREGGLAESRWARSQGTPSVEVHSIGGGNYSVACCGMVKSGVGRDDLGKTVQEILRFRAEYSDKDFARSAREAGFHPIAAEMPPAASVTPSDAREFTPPHVSGPLPSGVIAWDEAHRHAGKEIVVEGKLVRVHRAGKVLYLNFHTNWKKYLTVVVMGKDLRKFPKNPEALYKGKTVRVRGKVTMYKDRPEMIIRSPKVISVIK